MPWSPLQYTEEIFKSLKDKGYEDQVTTLVLEAEIMRCTQLIRSKTIKRVMMALETLGHLKQTDVPGVWKITYWDSKKNKS